MRLLWILMAVMLLATAGCGPKKDAKLAEKASAEGRWDEAYKLWDQALQENPGDTRARIGKERARLQAAIHHLDRAHYYRDRRQFAEAEFELRLAQSLDPDNQEARRLSEEIFREIEREKRNARQPEEQGLSTLPQLRPITWAPQDLIFVNQSIRDIYQSLGQAYGVNIVVDSKIRNDKITLDLRNLDFLKALDTLMVVNRHFFKVIDDNTIIILEDNKTNRDRYDNQIIQTFYLSNITPADLKNHLRVLLNIKEFAENEKLNAITIKGTPQQIALAEKMIATNDKAQAEVIVEIELLEVNKGNLRRLGIKPINPIDGGPGYSVGFIADPVNRSDSDSDSNGVRGIFPSLNSDDILTILPAIAVDFLRETGDSKQVANPHLRVTSGERGTVRIGQRIPILQTSFTSADISGSAGGGNNFGDQALATFQYNDVGIRIDVTPRVHFNEEVTLTMELEVTSVVSSGLQPTLGRRLVTTSLRLKNGETNVLAGLLTNEERRSLSGIPGLSRIPILGKLFSSDEKVVSQSDIIMTIRPVIVRGPNITGEDRAPYELSSLTLSKLYGESAQRDRMEKPIQRSSAPVPDSPDPFEEPEQERRPIFDPEAQVMEESGDPFAEESYEDSYSDEEEDAPPAMLSFAPLMAEARQDETMEFQLFITNVEDMERGEIVLEFDPAVLACESVTVGDFFDSRNKLPLMTPNWNNTNGRVAMIITQRASSGGFSGAGIMATVKFRAKAPGAGVLDFSTINLLNNEKANIQVQGLPGSYEVFP